MWSYKERLYFYAVPMRAGGRRYELPGLWRSADGPGAPCVKYAVVFLCNVGYNYVVNYLVDGTCGQRPSCLRRSLICFLTFPRAVSPLLGGP